MMSFELVDSHSKWAEVMEMSSATSTTTIKALRQSLATYGLPELIVSDNGPQFSSTEFQFF